jgi:Swt1-like HEPN
MAQGDSINALENILRDLIERVLRNRHAESWADRLGITQSRREGWERRREEERKKRTAGTIDERLLYYADFTDLLAIIEKNWDPDFLECFGDLTELRVYLEKLADLRNPDAHSRALLEVEEHLIAGMTGELRQKVTIFLSKGGGGAEPEHFARIEEIVDSFGNRITGKASGGGHHQAKLVLRPGDRVVFHGRAWDPEGLPLAWKVLFWPDGRTEKVSGSEVAIEWSIADADIGEETRVIFSLISARPYSRLGSTVGDDQGALLYTVLPRLTSRGDQGC